MPIGGWSRESFVRTKNHLFTVVHTIRTMKCHLLTSVVMIMTTWINRVFRHAHKQSETTPAAICQAFSLRSVDEWGSGGNVAHVQQMVLTIDSDTNWNNESWRTHNTKMQEYYRNGEVYSRFNGRATERVCVRVREQNAVYNKLPLVVRKFGLSLALTQRELNDTAAYFFVLVCVMCWARIRWPIRHTQMPFNM